jgi:hypothetical protein
MRAVRSIEMLEHVVLHSTTSKKTIVFIVIAVRTPGLTCIDSSKYSNPLPNAGFDHMQFKMIKCVGKKIFHMLINLNLIDASKFK